MTHYIYYNALFGYLVFFYGSFRSIFRMLREYLYLPNLIMKMILGVWTELILLMLKNVSFVDFG